MAGWLETAASQLGVDALDAAEIDLLLDVAREVAHGTERRYAPLTAFLLGVHVGGDERSADLRAAVQMLRQQLPDGD